MFFSTGEEELVENILLCSYYMFLDGMLVQMFSLRTTKIIVQQCYRPPSSFGTGLKCQLLFMSHYFSCGQKLSAAAYFPNIYKLLSEVNFLVPQRTFTSL